jgi:hypothetical protein
VRKLKEYIHKIPAAQDYSQIWRRVRKSLLDIRGNPSLSHKDEDVVVSLNSSRG